MPQPPFPYLITFFLIRYHESYLVGAVVVVVVVIGIIAVAIIITVIVEIIVIM
jgi:hypothetical protein